jgi:hypothetical protein
LLVFFGVSLFEFVGMKRLAVLLLFILIYSTSAATTKTPESLALLAIKSVIDEYFVKNVQEIEIVNFGVKWGKAEGTIEKILRLKMPVPMRVTSNFRGNLQTDKYWLKKPSVVLFDSPENFNQTQPRIVFQSGLKSNPPHLVYVPNATIKDIQVVSDKNHTINKSIFLVNEVRDSIELATAFMFTPDACHTNQFKVINRFTRKNKWENSNFFVEKYSIFHGCTLELDFKDIHFHKVLNFTQKVYEFPETFEKNPIAFFMGPIVIEMFKFFDTYVVFVESQKIYIPPGELYGAYEKMFLPFDLLT